MSEEDLRTHERASARQEVVVADLHMRFGSMVVFMVKWAFASIPAVFLLLLIGALSWGLASELLVYFGKPKPEAVARTAISELAATGETETAPIAAQDPEAVAYREKLLVRNVEVGKSPLGEDGVFGEIKNSGTRTLKMVRLTIYALDESDNPIFEKTYKPVVEKSPGAVPEPLKPGYSRQFGVRFDDAPSEWSGKVRVKVTEVAFQ